MEITLKFSEYEARFLLLALGFIMSHSIPQDQALAAQLQHRLMSELAKHGYEEGTATA